ncbi:MAG: hypothetical protein HPY50_00425 [Firmicutes bacterium]|nr:hypothetical protein [Bacillota bacterium]
MELTPEERKKIYEEEKARLESDLKVSRLDAKKKKELIWIFTVTVIVVFIFAIIIRSHSQTPILTDNSKTNISTNSNSATIISDQEPNENSLLDAAIISFNDSKNYTSKSLICGISSYATLKRNDGLYLQFVISPSPSKAADTQYAIFKMEGDRWKLIFSGHCVFDDDPPLIKELHNSFNNKPMVKSIILDYSRDKVYYASESLPTYQDISNIDREIKSIEEELKSTSFPIDFDILERKSSNLLVGTYYSSIVKINGKTKGIGLLKLFDNTYYSPRPNSLRLSCICVGTEEITLGTGVFQGIVLQQVNDEYWAVQKSRRLDLKAQKLTLEQKWEKYY